MKHPTPSARRIAVVAARAFAAAATCTVLAMTAAAAEAARPAKPGVAAWPEGPRNVLIRPEVEARVEALLAKLTLEEKVGQMIQADIDSIRPEDLRDYKLGSILAGGNAAPGGNVRALPRDWLALTDAFARAAEAGGSASHAPIPLLFGIDAVHGHARIPGATIFPHNVGLGAAHDPALITRIGRVTAAEVASTGVDWTFAPTVAVVRDVRWGRSYESYSEEPTLVASYSAAMVTGLQGAIGTPEFMAPGHTVSSVKHFMGDGGTVRGRDQFDNRAPTAEFARVHAAGYPPAIAAGVLTVMASYNSWHGTKMHANRELLTGVLKERFGFNGFVVGDWNAQEEVPGCTKLDCPAVIRAGLDMFMAPDSWKELYRNTLRHARSGAIPESRINDAVRRILRVKVLAGLFERPPPAARPGAGTFDELGSAAHRAVAREAVRKSLVLIKNEAGLLPLRPAQAILVAGAAADDIGQQAGGWTIDWQGSHNTNADFPGATSIYAGLKHAIEGGGGTAEFSRDGHYVTKPAAAIVVFGETPYAEFQGDRETLEYSPGEKGDLELIRRLRADGIPVIAVFLSGRPLWVNPEINASNAFVAAWLPGSEGGGIADVLIRRKDNGVNADFTGTLSFSWPATPAPITFTANDVAHGALFARGYGLSYAHPGTVQTLAEAPRAAPDRGRRGLLFSDGRVTAPWSVYVQDALAEVRLTTPEQQSPGGAIDAGIDAAGMRAHWSDAAVLRIAGRPVDLRRSAANGDALTIRLRVTATPAGAVLAGIRCSKPFGAEVPTADLPNEAWLNCKAPSPPAYDVTSDLSRAPAGSLVTLTLPLHCFAERGADLSAVEAPFVITTRAALGIEVTEVRLEKPVGPAACPAPH